MNIIEGVPAWNPLYYPELLLQVALSLDTSLGLSLHAWSIHFNGSCVMLQFAAYDQRIAWGHSCEQKLCKPDNPC